jgi:hypothetical protein
MDDESAPMIFFDTDYWTNKIPVYQFLQDCLEIKSYANLRLSLSDDIEEVYKILEDYVKMLESSGDSAKSEVVPNPLNIR